VREHRADLIHAHMSDGAVWAGALAPLVRRPYLVTHHSYDPLDTVTTRQPLRRWLRSRLLVLAARHAALNIAVSPPVAEALTRLTGVTAARLRVIPNGIALPDPALVARVRARRLARTAGLTLLSVGRLTREKGLQTLIAAAPRLAAALPGVRIVLVGDGAERGALEAQARALGCASAVRFVGAVAAAQPFFEEADIYLSASTVEGLPLAVLEAMATGVPVVATDIPAQRALLAGGGAGALFAVGDAAALTALTLATVQAPVPREERVAHALALVQAEHTAALMAQRYLQAYRDASPARPGLTSCADPR
jgi:glycosyltransferase involved in cell wall biosynthesis